MRRFLLVASSTTLLSGAAVLAGGLALGGCRAGGSTTATLPATPSADASVATDTPPAAAQMGEQFEYAGLLITMREVIDPLTTTESASLPLPGYHFVGLNFSVENPSVHGVGFSPAVEYSIVDQDGERYGVAVGMRQSDFLGQDLPPGAKMSGSVMFEIPDGRRPVRIELRRQGARGVDVTVGSG